MGILTPPNPSLNLPRRLYQIIFFFIKLEAGQVQVLKWLQPKVKAIEESLGFLKIHELVLNRENNNSSNGL
jgi:hypothetical protein